MYTPRRGNTVVEDLRTKDRIQNSGWLPSPRAVMRSCPSTTSGSHRALRLSRRNFNTLVYLTNVRPPPPPLSLSLSLAAHFRSSAHLRSSSSSSSASCFSFSSFSYPPLVPLIRPTLFRPSPLCVPFSVEFLQVLPIYREENSFAGKIAFLYFPATKPRTGKTRRGCETGIGNLLSVKRTRSPTNLSRTKLLTDPWCLDRLLASLATRDSYTPKRELVK